MANNEARLETFTLGGQGINLLAKDPLLPAAMVDTGARAQLWQTMLTYDRVGQAYWAGARSARETTDMLPARGLVQTG